MNHRPSLPSAAAIALTVFLAACAAEPATTPEQVATSDPAPMSDPASPSQSAEPTATGGRPTDEASPVPSQATDDPLLSTELTDVRSGESFTLAELAADEGPVLLEPMAIWCSSCRAQQHEVKRAHETGSFASVSLDVELTEHPEDLARYADDQGWDWHFAMADAVLFRLLQERFTLAATHPPSTPLIVIERDGTVRALEFGLGVRSAEQLLAELGAG